jgi:hypothetical protein
MPMFTARLDDREMARMRELAAGAPLAALLRRWIAGGVAFNVEPHAACDSRIRELEAEVGRLRGGTVIHAPVDSPVDVSTPSTPVTAAAAARAHTGRPAFLAAPDDDCVACGHDRQEMHMSRPDGKCRCGCPAFVDSAEPF